jgi:hypothetical protein
MYELLIGAPVLPDGCCTASPSGDEGGGVSAIGRMARCVLSTLLVIWFQAGVGCGGGSGTAGSPPGSAPSWNRSPPSMPLRRSPCSLFGILVQTHRSVSRAQRRTLLPQTDSGTESISSSISLWRCFHRISAACMGVFSPSKKTAKGFSRSPPSGLTVGQFAALPFEIGTVSPAAVPAGRGAVIKLRGSGFRSGCTATLGGKSASVSFQDMNALNVTAPALSPVPQQSVTSTIPGEEASPGAQPSWPIKMCPRSRREARQASNS